MATLLKSGGRVVDQAQIRRVIRRCNCNGAVGRITPPKITGRLARFNGEIIGTDAVYPFVGLREGIDWENYMALIIVDCVARFGICSLEVD